MMVWWNRGLLASSVMVVAAAVAAAVPLHVYEHV
jgi:hypothetical protein